MATFVTTTATTTVGTRISSGDNNQQWRQQLAAVTISSGDNNSSSGNNNSSDSKHSNVKAETPEVEEEAITKEMFPQEYLPQTSERQAKTLKVLVRRTQVRCCELQQQEPDCERKTDKDPNTRNNDDATAETSVITFIRFDKRQGFCQCLKINVQLISQTGVRAYIQHQQR